VPFARAIVFINGELAGIEAVAALLRPDDLLIAADGGARHLHALGRLPHLIVGDLDSVDPALVAQYAEAGVRIERHPTAKNQTDLELAIECALGAEVQEVLLVGATGGRIDHTLANVLILAQRRWPVPLRIIDGGQSITLLRGPGEVAIEGIAGQTLSAIPLTARVTGITYEGLEYPLHNATLRLGSTRGVSNRLLSRRAIVRIRSGLLLLALSDGD